MFDAHGWEVGDNVISHIQSQRAKDEYGSVENFVRAHENGREGNFILNPLAALTDDHPKVLLTSYFAFTPWDWPCLTFHDESRRDTIIAETKPGFLALIYGSSSRQTDADERSKVLGIYQCSHKADLTSSFLSPEGLKRQLTLADGSKKPRWNYAIEAIRAWRVSPETAPNVAEFAPTSYSPKKGKSIARYGVWLTPEEARTILSLDLIPEPTSRGREQVESIIAPAKEAMRPSRPGPVSKNSFMVGESEGPKHLYILKLEGNADHFLEDRCGGRSIIKVGFSKSPITRCRAFNSALPKCAFQWRLEYSTALEGLEPFPTSDHAISGENEMKNYLDKSAKSLGNEFFLADENVVERAWKKAKIAAEEYNK